MSSRPRGRPTTFTSGQVRITVNLFPEQAKKIRALARQSGRTVAEVVRQAIERLREPAA